MKKEERKNREMKTETNLGHCKIQETKLLFLSRIGWLDSVNILANHRPRSWKSLEMSDCFEAQLNL